MKKKNPYIVEGTIKNGTVRYKTYKPTIRDWLENIACLLIIICMLALWIYIFYGLGFFEAL